ncbi:MAG: thioredoxin [Nanoarchaeota archaeon]
MSVTEITQENFEREVSNSDIPVLIDFWAVWCPPCKMLAPVFEQVSQEFEDKVKFAKVNIDEQQNLANNFSVTSIPTLVLVKEGEEIGRMQGHMSTKQLKEKLEQLL